MLNESFGIVPIVVLHVSQLYYTLRRDNIVGRTIFLKHFIFVGIFQDIELFDLMILSFVKWAVPSAQHPFKTHNEFSTF